MKQALLAGILGLTVGSAAGQSKPPVFEVASVKSAPCGERGGQIQWLPGGRLRVSNVSLNFIILTTFQLRDFQLTGDPKVMALMADGECARYYIEANANEGATEQEVREMAKALLAERFQFKFHRETREMAVYALVPGKNYIKLPPPRRPAPGGIALMDRGWIESESATMEGLIQVLARSLDRPLFDKTGVKEAFSLRLTWSDAQRAPDPGAPASTGCPETFAALQSRLGRKQEAMDCPSFSTALQDQLGLRLEQERAPIEVLVVDHVEKPSSN
jgi:uncharacterized protein (TIGR03435 family)